MSDAARPSCRTFDDKGHSICEEPARIPAASVPDPDCCDACQIEGAP